MDLDYSLFVNLNEHLTDMGPILWGGIVICFTMDIKYIGIMGLDILVTNMPVMRRNMALACSDQSASTLEVLTCGNSM